MENIKSTASIKLSPEGLTSTAKSLDSALTKTTNSLNKIAATADKAINSSSKAGQEAVTKINAQIKALSTTLGQIKAIQAAVQSSGAQVQINQAKFLGGFSRNTTIGKQAIALTNYTQALNGSASALTTIRNRSKQFEIQAASLAKTGQGLTNGQLLKSEKIRATATAYSKVSNEIGNLRGRVALLSTDGQKAFKPLLDNLSRLEQANAKAFSNRRRSNFSAEIAETQKATRAVREALIPKEKLEKQTRLNTLAIREEAAALSKLSVEQRKASLASKVRAAERGLKNTELLGGQVVQPSAVALTDRYSRAVARAAANTNLLKKVLDKPTTQPQRLQLLIAQHDRLQAEIAETIALQNRQNRGGRGTPPPAAGGAGFIGGFRSTATNLFGDEGGGSFGAGALVGRVGAYAAASAAVYGLITAVSQAVGFTIQFEDSLAQLQAISGSTGLEMERLSDTILKVSQNSVNSVLELTKSATVIAQAGFAGNEIEDILTNVVNLAGASGSSTDEAVDILTSSLGAFQLQASESTQVTDALVSALNDSKLSVNQVQLGLQFVGATAKQQNITFNELVSTLGAMADAGIRSGSTMSTGLRQMLVDFIDPSEKLITNLNQVGLGVEDIDVKTLGLVEVLTRLRDAGFQAYGSLETRAAAAFTVLSTNIDRINELQLATLRQGAAEEAQQTRLDSLSAKWQQLLNLLAEVGSQLGTIVIPVLKVVVEVLTVFATLVRDIFGLVGRFATSLYEMATGADLSANSVENFKDRLIDAGLSAEEAELEVQKLGDGMVDLETASKDASAELRSLKEHEATLASETAKLTLRQADLEGQTALVSDQVDILSSRFPGLRAEFDKTKGGIAGLISAMIALEEQAKRTIIAKARVVSIAQGDLISQADIKARDVKASLASSVPALVNSNSRNRRATSNVNPQHKRDVLEFNRLVQSNQFSLALDLATRVDSNHPLKSHPTLVKGVRNIASFRAQFETASATKRNADSEINKANFLLSDQGKQLSQTVRSAVADSTRVASQGSTSDGRNRAQTEAGLKAALIDLDKQISASNGDSDQLAVFGAAKAELSAALARVAPEISKDKKKKGGARSSRSNASRLRREEQKNLRLNQRALDAFNKNELEIDREEKRLSDKLHENKIDALKNAPTFDDLFDAMEEVDASLNEQLRKDTEVALAKIKKNQLSEDEISRLSPENQQIVKTQQARLIAIQARKSQELREKSINDIAEVLNKSIKKLIDETSEGIERQYNESLRFVRRNATLASARAQALNNPVGTNDVSDSFRTVKRREAEVAEDRLKRAEVVANDRRIVNLIALVEDAESLKDGLEADLIGLERKRRDLAGDAGKQLDFISVIAEKDETGSKLQETENNIISLRQQIDQLTDSNAALKAGFEAINNTPVTFSEGLSTAIQALRIESDAASSIGQDLINNLDQPLRATQDSFRGFFSDILTGTSSIGDAFARMTQRIIESILEMVAVAIANQAFSLLLSFIPGAGGGGGAFGVGGAGFQGAAGPGAGLFAGAGAFYRGGEIKGFNRGGEITSGLSTRDSTLINAAKGEFVIRKNAVDSIGTDTLQSLNARGAAALRDVGPSAAITMPAPNVETNVYVVSPEEQPQLGPNDVIAIITKDVLKGGSTKRLIKQVANG